MGGIMRYGELLRVIVFILTALAMQECAWADLFNPPACQATTMSGQPIMVSETPGMVPAWAITSWDSMGRPYIVLGPTFYQLPPLMQKFTRMHECAHALTRNPDEVLANCLALKWARMNGLTPNEEQYIGSFHFSLSPLPAQYGGSGAVFWTATIQRSC